MLLLPILAAFFVGSLTAIQSRANGTLADVLGSGVQAALVSFSVGLLLLSALVMSLRRMRQGVMRLGYAYLSRELLWWQLAGGVFGALFVFAQSTSVPVIGVALFAVALVSGQSSASLIVDRLGLGPAGKQAITAPRAISAILGVTAVLVAVSGRLGDANLSPALVALCFIAGIGVAIQQAINGTVSRATREPIVAAWVNFVVGTAVLFAGFGLALIFTGGSISALPTSPLWLYLGGFVGVTFIATAAWVVGKVGVLRLSVLAIAGQLSGSLVLDWWTTDYVDLGLVIGVLIAFAAVLVSGIKRQSIS